VGDIAGDIARTGRSDEKIGIMDCANRSCSDFCHPELFPGATPMDAADEFAPKFEVLRNAMNEHANQMDAALKSFVELVPSFLVSWSENLVKAAILNFPDRSKALGPEKIKTIKSELTKLLSEIPERVAEEFKDPKYWISQRVAEGKVEEILGSHNPSNTKPACVGDFLRCMMGRFAIILDKDGLLEKKNIRWESVGQSSLRYATSVPVPLTLEDCMQHYR